MLPPTIPPTASSSMAGIPPFEGEWGDDQDHCGDRASRHDAHAWGLRAKWRGAGSLSGGRYQLAAPRRGGWRGHVRGLRIGCGNPHPPRLREAALSRKRERGDPARGTRWGVRAAAPTHPQDLAGGATLTRRATLGTLSREAGEGGTAAERGGG